MFQYENKIYTENQRKLEKDLAMGDRTHMKKEAVKMRPMASITTARVGYHVTATGLAIGFGALRTQKTKN